MNESAILPPCPFRDTPQVSDDRETASNPLDLPVVRGIDEIPRFLASDGTELLQNRYLSRRGAALLIGPTGIGKSALLMQWLILWALGQPAFGIAPTGALRILLMQAENDDGDLAEMRDGVVAGLGLTDEDRVQYNAYLRVVTESSRSGFEFVGVLDQILTANLVDLVVLDPLFAYLGCDAADQAGVTTFLRNGLNPILKRHNCGALVVHHTNKPSAGQNRSAVQAGDHAYLGAGSAEFAIWGRAGIVLKSIGRADVFEFRLGKRGARVGWREPDGVTARYSTQISHSLNPGELCWHEILPADQIIVPLINGARGNLSTKADVLKLVSSDEPIEKDRLVATARQQGIGINKAKGFINDLIADGSLLVVPIPRAGTRPEITLVRANQPPETEICTIDTHGVEAHTDHPLSEA